MATAVLMIDMPDKCFHCPESDVMDTALERWYCRLKDKEIEDMDSKPDWCPLASQTDDETAWYDQGYIDGWNDCLDSGGDFTKRKPWRRDD